MQDKTFEERLAELSAQIQDLPQPAQLRLREAVEHARERHEKMRGIIAELSDSLDHLRLSVKYLVFDLEATRRENKFLREMVEELRKSQSDGDEDDLDQEIGGE